MRADIFIILILGLWNWQFFVVLKDELDGKLKKTLQIGSNKWGQTPLKEFREEVEKIILKLESFLYFTEEKTLILRCTSVPYI